MKYILQIFAGSWQHKNYETEEIIKRLSEIIKILPVEKAIIGWVIDPFLYKEIGVFLHANGIEMLLWLPVFSETDLLLDVDASEDVWGKPVGAPEIEAGDGFTFCCPSSQKNRNNTKLIFDTHFVSCGFDGVFLDRIRTQAFVMDVRGPLSCGCASCRSFYESHGLSLSAVAERFDRLHERFFDISSYSPKDGYAFSDPVAASFFDIKADLIADAVNETTRYFHAKGLSVGLDLFAPLLGIFVGQDYKKITKEADFIKPMLYRRTEAPAGIGYDYGLLLDCLNGASGFQPVSTDDDLLRAQLLGLQDLPCAKYPGIEVNYEAGIVETDPAYIRDSLQIIRDCGADGAVLSWDVMMAPMEHILAARL
ncbi:MAG: hypothetical protein J6Y57_04200 [Lachnospiraceae bacterium]|nr:hypothetical protein [Lachnospiraceae bacterium]